MPELPEVQTTVNGINQYLKGLTIRDVWTDYKSAFYKNADNVNNPSFFRLMKKEIVGRTIVNASRRGKNVLIHLSGGATLLIHMKMTGHIMYGAYKKLATRDHQGEWWRPLHPATKDAALHDPFNRFIHFVLVFSNGKHMVLSDVRRFAKVTLIKKGELLTTPHLAHHGPEPLDPNFTVSTLKSALERKQNGPIKLVLMNHEVLSGIGNIYSDEILWQAGIHPLEKVKNVPTLKWPLVYKAMIRILNHGIDFGGDSMSDYRDITGNRGKFQNKHNAYRKTGTACVKRGCKGIIVRLPMGGRSAHFCDTHQNLLKK